MGGLFGSTPKVEPPSRMPDPQDPAVLEAKRREQAEIAARGGRQSTILTDMLSGRIGGKLGAS